jgi:hypothetical protein
MPTCAKCGSQAAYWAIIDKKNDLQEYCDVCFKKYDLAKSKKEMDEYHSKERGKDRNADGSVKGVAGFSA